jgi:ribosomal protein L29
MDIEKRIEELEKTLLRLESRYSQSNPVDVLAIRALKKEIARLNTELGKGKTPSLGVGTAPS